MRIDLKSIAPLIMDQFPSFYKEEGDNFLQFVKAYYEWMDHSSANDVGVIHKERRLPEYKDIDTTLDEYLDYFTNKFMHGIPKSILSDKRLLEKHILDVYRSKGTVENLKLLFRLLYNKEIEVYIPQVDMMRASDGKWVRRRYLEVTPASLQDHFSYIGTFITGSTSLATAFVEDAIRLNIGTQPVFVLYLTDITNGPFGQSFLVNEYVTYGGQSINSADYILGSAVSAYVLGSSENFALGDEVATSNPTGKDLRFNVSKLLNSDLAKGNITFKLVDGGEGYTLDSSINISYRTATQGVGANFKIGSLSNTSTFSYNNQAISGNEGTSISAPDYGADLNFTNIFSNISAALTFQDITVGTIASLTAATSGNRQYNGSLNVNVFEARTYGYGITGQNGGFWGNNSLITGELSAGNGVIQEVRLLSSGFGYNTQGEVLRFVNVSNTNLEVDLSINIDGVGTEEGYWRDQSSFLNDGKYLQDSFYYQEFSYEIQVEKSFDKYVDVIKKLGHPVGNRMFGKPLIIDSGLLGFNIVNDDIVTD